MSLNQALQALNTQGLAKMPPTAKAILQKGLRELWASGLAEKALQVGQKIPEAVLPNAFGQSLSIQDLYAQGPLVISFYRGSWCPYCNLELRAQQAILPELQALGAQLVAISPELPDHSLDLKEKLALEFEVLTDRENAYARSLGLVFAVNPDLQAVYRGLLKLNLNQHNGSTQAELPIPATYVVNRSGKVILAHIQADYTQRMEPDSILQVLKFEK
ncbi:alkyl hydroperoxide reductase [bacterium (Candidatus Blackallbacteria) CG17_big_fil_post_rev_8_21_14_2_50_48_46]|uniref:thioredoxin-dependent peroxiredoxin n=1 Tax=bacterium (Candidatus Blackallbacteria) CG17_big_fil_post_rev_8_21_14_2_50_48_46 TaxID=2014261 RepID=A0A2M7G0R0_9BACT|nr:MAG: alkyl hydroperoxide reductase [bacterium (Candidatus Blackallbacteria) CG18_big_fil_WC_8_21_14_2_50_49_26]PIW15291.1 MAG: alkyl hydroperoxide reductase [bacterium (Candidatus Blackallbacteria) CG17_big_fil_post_rev_8_21_14_2_50_48_46]PIW45200.1 MAG: alkyl hydroperoxide reductase [bacterium (Candidatus Blackallbacteria) CG13_big_fil_rev_8_21_14_2_50_49_14]